jgi:hypothetical protein
MKEWLHRNPDFSLSLCLVFFIFIATSAAQDYIPPGASGGGSITLGDPTAGTVSIIAPSDINDWILSPAEGTNTKTGTLMVSADCNWRITATDQDSTYTKGYMTEWDGSNYVTNPTKLASPMQVSVSTGGIVTTGSEVTLPAGGTIATGSSTNDEQSINANFNQPVLWTDKVLTGGHKYRMIVTFTISAT